jgi:hypothetical protein
MLLGMLKDLVVRRKPGDEDGCLRLVRRLSGRGRRDKAIEVLDHLLTFKPDSADGLVLRASIKRKAGRPGEAVGDLARAAALAPDDPDCLYELAAVSHALGDDRTALEHCKRLRLVAPGLDAAYTLQAQIRLPGENYLQVVARVFDLLKPRTYVEIGVSQGSSIRLATPPTLAIGIDPEPQLTGPVAGNLKIFVQTSDAFFAGRDLRAELGGLPVDLAFIDGMHHFEYALRDFANLERCCARSSTILIHDCFPLDRETAERDRRPFFWSGDVWRLVVLLKKYRPDLTIHTIGTPPTGLGMVRNLDPDSRYLLDHYDQLCEEFLALDYSYIEGDEAAKLNVFPNEREKIGSLLHATRPNNVGSGHTIKGTV